MTDITPPGSRQLTEPERQAFHRLGLTPGHWAALVAAPFYSRSNVRAPNLRDPNDGNALERLRVELRVVGGYSDEAVRYWKRLWLGERVLAPMGTRLLAWYLATDLLFSQREHFLNLVATAAGRFVPPAMYTGVPPLVVRDLRRLIDAYLPLSSFTPERDPAWQAIPVPDPATMNRLGLSVASGVIEWPRTRLSDVPARMPALVRLMGESVHDWWAQPNAARRAAERGLTAQPSHEREALFEEVRAEWYCELKSGSGWLDSGRLAALFVNKLREWVDAVRKSARESTRPALAVPVAPPEPEARALPVAYPTYANDISAPIVVSPPQPAPPPPVSRPEPPREQVPEPKPSTKPTPERVTVSVAESFRTVPFAEALDRASGVTVTEVCAWVEKSPTLLFDDCRPEHAREIAIVPTDGSVPRDLWLIGDIHADVLALANIIEFAELRGIPESPPAFVFLGDFVDRGTHDHETLLLLFRLMMEHSERVCIIPGNHDIDLKFDESMNRFRVTIEPAEYCVALNSALSRHTPEARERIELAKAFTRFCSTRPKALFFPDGTLFSHGGFPHLDMQKSIESVADLCQPRCLDDFLWARIAETAKTKRPNRGSRGHEFGWDTLVQFCKVASSRLTLSVRRLVRGHDHVPDRWQEYPDFADNGVPVLTLNAMGRVMEGEFKRDGRPHPLPVVARCVANHLPEVIQLPLDPAEVDRAFPKEHQQPVTTRIETRERNSEHSPSDSEQAAEGSP
ncbi:MAG: serine/threonine protein phosphatase [Planctomycetia bacterium]|nr:serine/threonine protein phosphatase [Planctomycetia bacterium]